MENKKAKIGAIIVTYNPELIRLKLNIKAVVKQVDFVVIVDNGSKNLQEIVSLVDKMNSDRLSILKLNQNLGIATAQNAALEKLDSLNYEWGVTLDQDSILPSNAVQAYKETDQFSDPTTGILAAQYDDPKWTAAQRNKKLDSALNKVVQRKMVIASGNLVNIKAWQRVNGFDEWMFIDQVDFDFDARLLLAGYKIWQVNSVIMKHAVGKVIQRPLLARSLLFPKYAIFADHSPFREYYIQRNTIVYSKRYPEFRRHRFQILVSMIQSRRILVYSGPRLLKLVAAWHGIISGIKYNVKKDKKFQEFRRSLL